MRRGEAAHADLVTAVRLELGSLCGKLLREAVALEAQERDLLLQARLFELAPRAAQKKSPPFLRPC